MTTGIISALNRNVSVSGHYMTLIQTDCAINSGNSGGPLINLYGQVIGICNMKMMSTSTTVEGLGFAIPTNTVKTIVNKLLSQGEVVRAMLGITAYNLDQSQCRSYGIDGGIMVVQVSSEADAYAKGIRNGDVIIAAHGIPISSVNQLNTMKADMSPGDVLTLTLLRDGEELDVDVILMEQSVVN
jgi:serine protease Do